MTIALLRPTHDLLDSWMEAVSEFGGGHVDGASLLEGAPADRVALDELVLRAVQLADTSIAPPEGFVHNDLYWIVDDGEVVGFISLRHELNEYLHAFGGHIGYSVRPSRRRQGYATAALSLALDRAREIGLDRVLLTCDDDNVASARTIENAGGELEDVREGPEGHDAMVRRYWITL